MTEQLAECLLHVSHTVLGRRLRPFTFWHSWILEFAKSPFVCGGDVTDEDLIFAVEVLSRPPGVPGRAVRLPRLGVLAMWLRILRLRHSGSRRAHAQLRTYFADHVALPDVWSKDDARAVKSDISLYSVAVLMRHGRKTEAEAWATEVGYGRHLVLALAEAGGHDIELVTAAEREALREAGH